MIIHKIKTDDAGFRLICASKVIQTKKGRRIILPSVFLDYKNGVLRWFNSAGYEAYPYATFKQALKFILQVN